jgi:cytochrome b pre-mRNA-processing protein 3
MILDRLFRPRPAQTAGRTLYASAVEQARKPGLYSEFGAPDTVEGRFEIYTLHVYLILDRLRRQGAEAQDVSQVLFDTYVRSLDDALREMGVGDLSVGKKMRRLGEAFYGRVKAYDEALDGGEGLEPVLTRTVYADADARGAPRLAAYALAQRAALAAQPLEQVIAGEVAWSDA